MPRIRYRDNMSADDTAALLADCARLDECYASQPDTPEPVTEDDTEEAEAAEEQSIDYFNRYIAGDR